jgi:hypothetical protein
MMSREMLVKRLRTDAMGTFTAVGWTPIEVYELWDEVAGPKDRRRFKVYAVAVGRATRITISPNGGRPRVGVAFALGLAVAAVFLGLAMLDSPSVDERVEVADQCWEWDRGNHTLVVPVAHGFEAVHDAYRKTGKAPDRLTECTE